MTDVKTEKTYVDGWQLNDAATLAMEAWRNALAYCAGMMGLTGPEEARAHLLARNPLATGYCHYQLAREIGEQLGAMDGDVQGVYLFDCEATPDDGCFTDGAPLLLHVLVRTRRKTAALQAVLAAMENALSQAHPGALDDNTSRHVLDAQLVDEEEVRQRQGYGALLTSFHHQPLPAWQR